MNSRYGLLAGILLLCSNSLSWAMVGDGSPTAVVEKVVDQVVALLQDQNMDQMVRRQRIGEIIAPHFDFEAMSRSILAHKWKKTSPSQRERFVELFSRLLKKTYVVAMEAYTDQKVRIGKQKSKGKRALVETFIEQDNGVSTPVSYKLRRNSDGWYAYDVIVEGVSLVSNYRSTFRSIVKRDGMDGLLEQLAKKVQKG